MLILAAKVVLAPACVAAVSLVARRWGPRIGGLAGALPVVGGPILLVLALMHGRVYGGEAAAASLTGMVALSAFVVAYGRTAPRAHPAVTVLVAWTAFLAVVAAFSWVDVAPVVGLALCAASFALALVALPAPHAREVEAGGAVRLPWWDIPVRMLSALALVLIISAVSASVGSRLSGLLAPFPIITAVLAVFTHLHGGPDQVRLMLRGFLAGFYAYAIFNFVVAAALPGLAIGVAFGLALAAALAVQALSAYLTGRPQVEAEVATGASRRSRASAMMGGR